MIETILRTIDRYRMFSPGLRLGVAVSGGADSMCLLQVLHQLAPRWDLHLSVVHIDHGLRGPESRADAEFVRRAAAQFALPFHLREVNLAITDDNLEQAGREARHDFYAELISAGRLDKVATGHTRSDQAETVLYRLLRGSGLAGLCGILPVTASGLVRPLLDLGRSEIEAWLRERGIEWREDETNQHRTFARNRLRHDILPALREAFNARLDEILAHMAVLAQDEEDWWRVQLDAEPYQGAPIFYPIAELTGEHPAMARRLIRQALGRVKGDLRQINFAHVETVLEMARSSHGSGRIQLPGLDIFRSFDWIRIASAGFDSGRERDFQFPVTVPGSVTLPEKEGLINFELTDKHDSVGDEIDWKRLPFFSELNAVDEGGASFGLLELRNWRPGDRYQRIGQSHGEKLKTLFQEARIPLWERRHWPVLVCGDRVVWTRRFGTAADFAVAPDTREILVVKEQLSATP